MPLVSKLTAASLFRNIQTSMIIRHLPSPHVFVRGSGKWLLPRYPTRVFPDYGDGYRKNNINCRELERPEGPLWDKKLGNRASRRARDAPVCLLIEPKLAGEIPTFLAPKSQADLLIPKLLRLPFFDTAES